MALPPQKFREMVFQLLYSDDMGKGNPESMITLMMKELSVTKRSVKEALTKVHAIKEHLEEIDAAIERTSQAYSFDRIHSVERNVLRMGVYEMMYDESIPPKVAISEANRIAKKFGTPESVSFVNAILDSLYKESLGEASPKE